MGEPRTLTPHWTPFQTRRKHGTPWPDILAVTLLLAATLWVWFRVRNLPSYGWNWHLLTEFICITNGTTWHPGLLLQGIFTTLRLGLWSLALSLLLGTAIGIASTHKNSSIRDPILALVNLIRSTPPLVILFSVYFFAGNLLPISPLENAIRQLHPDLRQLVYLLIAPPAQLDRFLAAILALGTYQAMYVAEIVRGSINSIPRNQWEAATALGFDRQDTLRLIIIPQALRLMLPPLTGQAISTFKDSALASLISVPDLTFQSLEIMAVTDMTFEIWCTTAVIYLAIGCLCALIGTLLERHLNPK